jgi:hypothetical protein
VGVKDLRQEVVEKIRYIEKGDAMNEEGPWIIEA